MPPDLEIRALKQGDLDSIFTEWGRQYGEQRLDRQARSEVYVAVGEVDGVPVGRIGMDFVRFAVAEDC